MSNISPGLRWFVATRAENICEYFLLHSEDMFFGGHIDHIISEKHGGRTQEENLAFACAHCNRYKGSDVASLVPESGELVRLFNPRTDRWSDHFRLDSDGVTVLPLTTIGEVTCRTLRMNESPRLLEREALRQVGRYPPPGAKTRLGDVG